MNLAKKRWVTLIACCFINLCLGSIYVWSVFASSMAEFLSAHNGVSLTTADLAIYCSQFGWTNHHDHRRLV